MGLGGAQAGKSTDETLCGLERDERFESVNFGKIDTSSTRYATTFA